MSDPTAGPRQEPSPEELRAYVEQLRGADVAEVVAQAFSVLATGAEVKLGRPDARVLIDVMAAIAEASDARVPADLTQGIRNAVSQLQMAQVQAEREATGGDDRPGEQTTPQPGAPRTQGEPSPQQQADQRMTDRLWVPGKGPPPP